MKTLERADFREVYGESTARVAKAVVGETVIINGHKITVKDIKRSKIDSLNYTKMLLSDNGEDFILDLCPHWERGRSDEIHLCREGVMNLIRAVYAQTERDYEQQYLYGYSSVEIERLPGESDKSFEARRKGSYNRTKRECERLLGPVFTKYAKVKALWGVTHDVNEIADRLGETPEHIANLVDRLGLNRTETGQDDDEF